MASCSYFKKEEVKKEVVARAYDKYLYYSDLKDLVPKEASHHDSIVFITNYIDSWIRQNVILHKAEVNLSEEQKNFEKQLQDYRNSLVTYLYEKGLIREKLDTIVSQEEIEDFYNNNKSNFELKDNIVKVLYLKLRKDSPKLDKIKLWYKSDLDKDKELLEEYCHQYAINFYLDDNTWLLFDDLLKEIPIKTYDKEQFLKNNRFIEIEDSVSLFLVNIKGFKIKDSLSPLSFEKDNIKNLILNQRKLILIEEMEKKAYEDALKNNDFEIPANKIRNQKGS
jgi:hypothetical protein